MAWGVRINFVSNSRRIDDDPKSRSLDLPIVIAIFSIPFNLVPKMKLCVASLFLPLIAAQWSTDNPQIYNPPADQTSSTYSSWNADRLAWIADIQPGLDLSIFEDFPEMNWTQTSFIQPQLMIHEKMLYDKVTNTFTVDK